MTEDPLVNPYSTGECLARLAQVRGAIERHESIAKALPANASQMLREAAAALTLALESGDGVTVAKAHGVARDYIGVLYQAACEPGIWNGDAAENFAALGFPDPLAKNALDAVDVSTVVVTHSQPLRQVMTSISFDHARGAKAYRLKTTRIIHGEEVHDDTITCLAPVFRRVRIPAGEHRVRIESRDDSGIALSDEFTIEVPPVV
ncbi:MAG TPA: hypothetical protein VF681_04920 [Abditibacteriaceae bacterium]|jgi:hypothetical protein